MNWAFLGQLGIILGFGMAVIGSASGIWLAGSAAAGAWARDSRAGKLLRFNYVIFVGAPLSQTFYAMLVMDKLIKALQASSNYAGLIFGIGLATGLGEMLSAWGQGAIGAGACRSLSDSDGKGLAFLLIAIGVIETVGIFTMVFMLLMAGRIPVVAG